MDELITKGGRIKSNPQCPTCKRIVNGFSSLDQEHSPTEGDYTICAYCLEFNVFTDNLGLRPFTDKDMDSIDSEGFDELLKVRKMLANAN